MRELWVKIGQSLTSEEKKTLIEKTSQIVSAYLTEQQDLEIVKKLGARTTVSTSEKADIVIAKSFKEAKKLKQQGKKVCILVTVRARKDEAQIVAADESLVDYILVECPDWKVIPLENLIAKMYRKTNLLAIVSGEKDAKTALETLELGVDGLVVDTHNTEEIFKIKKIIDETKTRTDEVITAEKILLEQAKVTEIKPLSTGARVCIDTCDLMKEGEGILVGCQSNGLFLVEAEVHETPFVAPRPFRVNAGSISLYVLAPEKKTRYLSELKAGDEVLIVDRNGRQRTTNIGRIKIEWRPLLMIEANCKGKTVKTILQNAETIRVITADGSKSVKDLKIGDSV
ncbi:MAG: 3-dehydroquinate synthase II, partial [Candidatus Bathyarchaeia archaeon]